MFPKKQQITNIEDVKEQITKIISSQRKQIESNLKTSVSEVQNLLSEISEFNDRWIKLPTIYRIAWIRTSEDDTVENVTFKENIELPNIDHDLELIMKMLNHMREEKNLKVTDMPLFIHPDEISIAQMEDRFPYGNISIISQIAVVFQKGRIKYVGVVIDRNYVLLQDRLINLILQKWPLIDQISSTLNS
ncbi:MAG: hypothetical protein QOK65_06375 [Nitrososphaeraceae archaeon]|nr:hypothetical protein [Nitrososphaeraceae archaeon]MDW0242250.1 hypothetical protein [Nitrososphaeraceae archaeon]MDW0248806.1 hypothetical protein [Nitrososphaeraceae archaeon]MDW0308094.1 hypothetical protein [Nitrososphaeraceae archaeon]